MTDWVDVVKAEDLPPGEWTTAELDDIDIAVFNLDGEFYAIENVCTHDGSPFTGGCFEGEAIVCPRHGAQFSVKTGDVLAPPAYGPVTTFPVRVENGMVQVRDDAWD